MRKNFFLSLLFTFVMTIPFILWADEIHGAAQRRDLAKVKAILEKDPDLIEQSDENGKTPLHWAAQEGHVEIVRFLLEKGADVNAKNKDDETPLHYASYSVRNDVVKLLIEKGAKVDSKNNFGRTALHLASYVDGSAEICRQLIKNGADINAKDFDGATPLYKANQLGRKETVNLLIEKGADLPTDRDEVRGFLHYAAQRGHRKLFDLLIANGASIRIDNGNGGTLLHSASSGGATSIAEYLIKMGFRVDAKDRYDITPLHLAASNGHKEVVELLLSKGADTNVRSKSGMTAFNYAEDKNHSEITALFKARDVDQSESQFPVLMGQYLGQKRPGTNPEIFALGIIISSISGTHSSPSFSPDGKEMYWTKVFRGTIMFMRSENGRWSAPQKAPFSSKYRDGEPAFSPNGKKLFFLSFRPIKEGDESVKENIWYVERVGNGWSDAKPVGDLVNALPLHWQVSIASNGNLYFGSSKAGGKGRQDIYVSRFINGQYSEPENLGGLINSEFYEHSPYIAPDESYLIFTRIDQGEKFWNSDLFISFRNEDGSWKKAKKIGHGINTDSGEFCPIVSPDGKYFFFLLYKSGNNNVYWVDAGFIKELKDKEMKDDFPVLKGPYLGQKPPGLVPRVFVPGIVSLENTLENGCVFSKDLTEFYFTREDRSKGQCWIFVSRLEDGKWIPPEVAPFSGKQFTDLEPHISPDGKTLFFVRMHPTDQDFKNGLWFARRTDTGWSDPQFFRLGMFASLTIDNSIYYTNLMQEKDQPDIVMSKFVDGGFIEPQPVGGGVDSPYLDAHPCIDPDEKFIVFDSRRASDGKGHFDLYVCFKQADGSWSEAFPLGERLGRGIKMCASISPDGKYLFYTHLVDNNADIYWVDAKIIEELKLEEERNNAN